MRLRYDLIVAHSCVHLFSAIDQQAILEAEIAQELFVAKGTIELEAGWRTLAPKQQKQSAVEKVDPQLPFVPLHTPVKAIDGQFLEKPRSA